MKKGTIILIVLVAIVAIVAVSGVGTYNKLVKSREEIDQAAGDIDVLLNRRAELIPNLVNTVKGFAKHETEVFDAVNAARAQLTGATTMEEKATADAALESALGRLIAIAEAYPELKSDQAYVSLMDELAGSENRISYARQTYNEKAAAYNKLTKTFPSVIFAKMFNYEAVGYYEAAPQNTTAPQVDLGA